MSEKQLIITDRSWSVERIWGASEIAKFAGVSVDTVYRWETLPDCPITKTAGRYFALKTPLVNWICEKR